MAYARRSQLVRKPEKSYQHEWVAPVAGWIANRSLAAPNTANLGPGAAVLDNFFPKATTVVLRRGQSRYATLEEETSPVTALFSYKNGANQKLFAANDQKIYNITSVVFPENGQIVANNNDVIVTENGDWFGWSSTGGLDISTGYTGGDWSTTQFATTGGVYLVGVNSNDVGFIYDGELMLPYSIGGTYSLPVLTVASFSEGETVTGVTSGATATAVRVTGAGGSQTLYLQGIVGTFAADEDLTGSDGGAGSAIGTRAVYINGVDFGGLSSADMSFVWVYKNRLWFAQKDSLSVWFLPVDAIAGAATEFPLGGVLTDGGSMLFGQAWAMESSGDGGLSEQCVFVSDLGQVAVYQGDAPDQAATWNKVGTYRIGKPLGKRAWLRGGGDLAICTSVGLVPLSKAISLDITALSVATVSYNITDAWQDAHDQRGQDRWQAILWPEEKMTLIAPPDLIGSTSPVVFVANTETGAWARYTGWDAHSFEIFRGRLYFGSSNGRVFSANTTGLDDGLAYTGTVLPLFDDFGSPLSNKISKVGRPRTRSNAKLRDSLRINYDYNTRVEAAPNASTNMLDSVWGAATWGVSTWGASTPTVVQQDWRSVGGMGYAVSPCYRVTSGSIAPIDVELIAIEMTYTTGGMVS